MLFNKVQKELILQGIKDFEEKGFPNEFGPSSTYDLVYEEKRYPPKAIMAYANFHAEGRTIEAYFKEGKGTDCFNALERNGFDIVEKSNTSSKDSIYTWVKTYKEIVNYLKDKKGDQLGLINTLKESGCDLFNDQDPKENVIPLEVMDPFTFFCYLNKYFKQRLTILQNLARNLNLTVPNDDAGLPSTNPQKVWVFPYKYLRTNNEIERLWSFFESVINNEITDSQFADILKIRGVAHIKLTEILFYTDPEEYFPINGPTKPYLKEVFGIEPKFKTFSDYKTILKQLRSKTDKPFYQLSYEAWLWNDQNREVNYWVFQGNPSVFDFEAAIAKGSLDDFTVSAHKDKIKRGDKVIVWLAGKKSGCYALAEVTSEPHKMSVSRDDKHWEIDDPNDIKAGIMITHNFVENPILREEIKDYKEFKKFKGGNPGSNFSATEEEFNTLLNWNNTNTMNYWLYAPGRSAEHWETFYKDGVMAIGWDKLGDLSQYDTKESIYNALKENYGGEGDKRNNVTANYEFYNKIKIGDVIIVKKGRKELLGYGIVSSDYYHNPSRPDYKSCRDVDWKLKGSWEANHSLVLKTLTNVTNYKSEFANHEFYYENLMSIMNGEKANKISKSSVAKPINQILYGPPGTGKTYYLKDQLFQRYTSKETSISKEQHFETVVSGCSWWQVIAIALLDLKKAKVSDIFENEWVQKKISLSNSKSIRPTLWGQLQSHTVNECEFVNVSSRQQPLIFNKTEDSHWEILKDEVEELAPELFELKNSVENYNPNPDNIVKHHEFVTFHQSFAYEDFIEGIKPILPEVDVEATESKDLGYTIEDGVFKNICKRATNDPQNRYAIFIDEINRGNVSAIFGELITLIETDKRKGAKNELSIKLPYSKKEFSVPSNLDIYGTMNTADRSVEALDTALRRRFEFKEMMPAYEVIQEETVGGLQLSEVLKTINQRIELLIDRDHTIGHSYFVNVNTPKKLAKAFNNKIVPLLQEYFYGDYGKIGLVLGSGFVKKIKNDKIEFASFDYENANDYKIPSYQLILVEKDSVIEAVELLLGKKESISE